MPDTQLVELGICLEVVAAMIGTFSKQLIAFGEYRKQRSVSAIGIVCNVIFGPITDASAYAFAPQTVVAPFAGLDVLFNAMTAPCTLRFQRERLDWRHLAAAVMVAGGAGSSAFFASAVQHNETQTCEEFLHTLSKKRSLLYLAFELLFVLLIIASLWTGRISGTVRGLALGGMAGILMGNAFFVKGFVGFVLLAANSGDWSSFLHLTPYAILAAAAGGSLLGTFFMQRGLRDYKGVYMVTVFEGTHISAACLSGDVVMGEMLSASWRTWVAYWASIFVIIGGIILVNTTAQHSEMDHSYIIRSFGSSSGSTVLSILEATSARECHERPYLSDSDCHGRQQMWNLVVRPA